MNTSKGRTATAHAMISVGGTPFLLRTCQSPSVSGSGKPTASPAMEVIASAFISSGLQMSSSEESVQFTVPIVMTGSKFNKNRKPRNIPVALNAIPAMPGQWGAASAA